MGSSRRGRMLRVRLKRLVIKDAFPRRNLPQPDEDGARALGRPAPDTPL